MKTLCYSYNNLINLCIVIAVGFLVLACSPKESEYISALVKSTTVEQLHGKVKEVREGYKPGLTYLKGTFDTYNTQGMLIGQIDVVNQKHAIQKVVPKSPYRLNDSLVIEFKRTIVYDSTDLKKKSAYQIEKVPEGGFNPYVMRPNQTHYITAYNYDGDSIYAETFDYSLKYEYIMHENRIQQEVAYIRDSYADDSVLEYTATYSYDALNRIDFITYECKEDNFIDFKAMGLPIDMFFFEDKIVLCISYVADSNEISSLELYDGKQIRFIKKNTYTNHDITSYTNTLFFKGDITNISTHTQLKPTKDAVTYVVTDKHRMDWTNPFTNSAYKDKQQLDAHGNWIVSSLQYTKSSGEPRSLTRYRQITYYEE